MLTKQVAISAGVVAALVVLAGLTILIADRSKPGDPLYAVDRALENTEVAFASLRGDKAKGELYLDLASERIDEISAVVGYTDNTLNLIAKVQAESNEVTTTSEQEEIIGDLVDDYADALEKANEALENLKGNEATQEQAEELANSILESGEEIENILVNIRGSVKGDTIFALDEAILLTTDYESKTYTILYFDLKNTTGEENQALPEAKVENRIEKAKRELVKVAADIEKSEGKISEENLTEAKILYQAALEAVERGEEKFAAGDLEGAYREVDLAYDLARQIKVFLREERKDEKKLEKEAARAIKRAEKEIKRAEKSEVDTSAAELTLTQAKAAYAAGDFEEAISLANSVSIEISKEEVKTQEKKKKEKDEKEGKGNKEKGNSKVKGKGNQKN